MVANLAQSPDVVEANAGDLVDVVLHGQLAVQVDTARRKDNAHQQNLSKMIM